MNGKEIKTTCHPRGFLSGISRLSPLSNQGFTLIELLVVVLIIGILAAIALPQYQKAVLKSRYTTLMPIAKGIAEGNEAYFMEHGTYADDPTELPIKGQESYPDGTELRVVDDTDKDVSYVIATRPKLMPNNKYIVFQKHSGKFSDVTLCEATADPLATWLCKDALKGQVVEGSSLSGTGWTGYALSGNTTGSSFTTALEQVAESIKAQNSNYEIISVDEDNGKVTLCDTSVAVVDSNGKCISTQGGTWNSTTKSYEPPFEVTYDEDNKMIEKKGCEYTSGGTCAKPNITEYDAEGHESYYLSKYCYSGYTGGSSLCTENFDYETVRKAIYTEGTYTGYIRIDGAPGNPVAWIYNAAGEEVEGSIECRNGADWQTATCYE